MSITNDLDFNVVWLENELFQVAVTIAKASDGLLAGLIIHLDKIFFCSAWAHAASAAAGSGFDHHGVADFLGKFEPVLGGFEHAIGTRGDGYTIGHGCGARGVFITHFTNHFGRRPDKFDIAAFANLHKARIL